MFSATTDAELVSGSNANGTAVAAKADASTKSAMRITGSRAKLPVPLNAKKDAINSLVGIRIFPALCVVLHHSESYFDGWHNVGAGFNLSQATCFFFVLSGFLLTHRYEGLQDHRSVFRFYLSRVSRVWPLHVASVVLLIALVPEVFSLGTKDLPALLSNIFMVQAWIPSWHYFYSYNAPSWNNSALLFIYLWFPLLLAGVRKSWYAVLAVGATIVIGLVAACHALHIPEFHPTNPCLLGLLYINPLARVLEFIIGMVASVAFANYVSKRSVSTLHATLIEVAAISGILCLSANTAAIREAATPILTAPGAFWLQNCGIPVLGIATLITIVATEKGLLARMLRTPAFVLLGQISFAVYMLHSVFLAYRAVNFPYESSAIACGLFVLTLLVASFVSHKLFEKPLQKWIIVGGNDIIGRSAKRLPAEVESKLPTPASKPAAKLNFANPLSLGNIVNVTAVVALAALLYVSVPELRTLSPQAAADATSASSFKPVVFGPSLLCRSASAIATPAEVTVDMVWEATQAQKGDTVLQLKSEDASGAIIGITTYVQNPRRSQVAKSTVWKETVHLALYRPATNARLLLAVAKGRRRFLLPEVPASSVEADKYYVQVPMQFVDVSATSAGHTESTSNIMHGL